MNSISSDKNIASLRILYWLIGGSVNVIVGIMLSFLFGIPIAIVVAFAGLSDGVFLMLIFIPILIVAFSVFKIGVGARVADRFFANTLHQTIENDWIFKAEQTRRAQRAYQVYTIRRKVLPLIRAWEADVRRLENWAQKERNSNLDIETVAATVERTRRRYEELLHISPLPLSVAKMISNVYLVIEELEGKEIVCRNGEVTLGLQPAQQPTFYDDSKMP